MKPNKLYQISTLQALAVGYTKPVETVKEFLEHGDCGLGTFENVDGEMIVADGVCYQAKQNGDVVPADESAGIPFGVVGFISDGKTFTINDKRDLDALKTELTALVKGSSGRNSVNIARIDGAFNAVHARSGAAYPAKHVTLMEILSKTQKEFCFERLKGTLICVYFPDHMDGVNASGWHMHFISEDKTRGGHVLDVSLVCGECRLTKMDAVEIRLPTDAEFDEYSLKEASNEEIARVEQGVTR